jgi:Xaa-Pro aminopeptidase
MKAGQPKVPTIPKFLADLAVDARKKDTEAKFKIGLDPFVHPATFAKEVEEAMATAEDGLDSELESDTPLGTIDTLDAHGNLVDSVWKDDRPAIPTSPFRVHPIEYAGATVQEKVKIVRDSMSEEKATLCVFPSLDEIAYLLNVRAKGDVDCNPVGISYCTVSQDSITLYCDVEHKVMASPEVKAHLEESGVTLAPYEDTVPDIEKHLAESKRNKVWIDKGMCNYAIARCVPPKQLVNKQNPVRPMKSIKNEPELKGMRQAHIVDGVAMAKFMAWLEDEVVIKGRKISEVEVDEKLTGERAKQEGFVEVAFPTIAGVGPNGAIIHYSAEPNEIMKYLDTTNPILIDSGGQYAYGTTDVTRTWHFGEAEEEFKDCYTRVLKGHIGLDTLIWPENTPGFAIDLMARKSLWEVQKDYGHGTGHGVGAALNVHEGPQGISPRWGNTEVLKAKMVVSNEPGYYVEGKFGIRIENLVEIVELEPVSGADENAKKFLQFKGLTVIPMQTNLMKQEIMSSEDIDWVDNYHSFVWDTVSPLVEEGTPEYAWLKKSCQKMERI